MNTTKKLNSLLLALLLLVLATPFDAAAGYGTVTYDGIQYDFYFSGSGANAVGQYAEVPQQQSSGLSGDVNIAASVTYEYTYTDNGTTYTRNLTAPVKTINDKAFYWCKNMTSVTIPNSVITIGKSAFMYSGLKNVIIGSSVTEIDEMAFESTGLMSVTIPNSVTTIGSAAFAGCRSMTSVILGDSVEAIPSACFRDCLQLTSVTIPNSVKAIGENAFYNCYNLENITIGNSVATIGKGCFQNCTSLTAVTIPNSVTSIGDNVFSKCTGLTSIDIPNSVTTLGNYVFSECSNLTSATIGNFVTSIGENAFYDCSKLTSIIIPNSVTSIGNNAFFRCQGLTNVTIGNSVASIGETAFYYCTALMSVAIPNSVITIAKDAFHSCENLTSVTLGNSVTTIGNGAFHNCFSLKGVNIPNSVTTIGNEAFWNCSSMTDLTIGNAVTTIGNSAFSSCTSLTSVDIPNSVTEMGAYAFAHCTSLTSVNITQSITQLNSGCFSECTQLQSVTIPNSVDRIWNNAFESCYSLENVTIGVSVHSIDQCAFQDCRSLTSVTIPDSVLYIGERAFASCRSLESVIIGEALKTINNEAFYDCTSLKSVTLGKSVNSIGKDAFQKASAIETITCKAETPPSWSDYSWPPQSWPDFSVFTTSVYNNTSLHVPTASEVAYKSSQYWGLFQNIIGDVSEEATTDRVQIDGIYYVLNEEDGTAMVTNYTGGSTVVSGKEYRGDIVIPSSVTADDGMTYTVTAIGPYAFTECHDLTSLTIPNTVTEIGYESINGCTALTSISIPNSVTRIGEHAFMNCTALESIDIPNSVISIGDCAFVRTPWYESQPDGVVYAGLVAYHYKGAAPENTEVVIQDGTIGIADCAFLVDEDRYPSDNFEGICSIVIPNSVKYLGEAAFLGDDMTLKKVTIGSGVEAMGPFALAWNFNLTDVSISEGVKVIGEQMFAACPALKKIIIPNSVEVIKYRAFSAMEDNGYIEYPACESLADVTIGTGVKTIEELAFAGCTALAKITCRATTPPALADVNCFDDECYENATLFVPAEAVDVYRTAPIWERFVNIQPVGGDNDITYEYVPFVREGVKWTYSIQDYHYEKDYGTNPARGDNKVYRTLEFRGDTVINGKTYKALHKCTDDVYSEPSDVIPIYLREEDKKVYGIVPDGIFYDDAGICITPYGLAPDDVILSGEEFLLYDFQDPVSYWDNLIDDDWFNLQLQLDTIEVGGHYAKRLFDSRQEGDYFQVIEGIGAMGMNSYPLAFLMPVTTGIHTTEYYNLEKVVENGEVIYPKDYVEDRYLPVIREGMKWVNEYVKISDEDTTSYYYTYEFKGNYPELDSYNRVFKAVYSKNYDANGVGNGDERLVAGLQEDEACILCFKNEPLGRRENFINFYTYQGNEDVCLLHENLERMYDIDYYINSQFDPDKNFLNTDNFVKADPIVIDGVLCSRIAYIGEQGDTLAYLVEGIGFDSRNLGDLLTPFTRYPDADCGCYIEYCGLSHVIKDGKIIYKGRLYQDGVTVGLDELPGDVNGDGSVNISDADNVIVIIINGGNGHDRVNEHGELIGDVNHDRVVNITDLNLIIDMIIKE